MPKRPKLPPEQYCIRCRKALDGKGWYGPACFCDLPEGSALKGAHRTLGVPQCPASGAS
jgi:hypothetical protein